MASHTAFNSAPSGAGVRHIYPAWSDNSNSTGDNPTINGFNNWTLNVYFTKVTASSSWGGQAPAAGGGSTEDPPATELPLAREPSWL